MNAHLENDDEDNKKSKRAVLDRQAVRADLAKTENSYAQYEAEFKQLQKQLSSFNTEVQITNLDTDWPLIQDDIQKAKTRLESARNQHKAALAKSDKSSEEAGLKKIELEAKWQQNKSIASANEGLGEKQKRLGRLLQLITELRSRQKGDSQLKVLRDELAQKEILLTQKLIARSEVDHLRGLIEAKRAEFAETPEIQKLNHEVAELDKQIVPDSTKAADIPDDPELLEFLKRLLDAQVEKMEAESVIENLESSIASKERRIKRVMEIEVDYRGIVKRLKDLDEPFRQEDRKLQAFRELVSMGANEIQILTPSKVGKYAATSNRKKIWVMYVGAMSMFAVGVVLAWDIWTYGTLPINA